MLWMGRKNIQTELTASFIFEDHGQHFWKTWTVIPQFRLYLNFVDPFELLSGHQ
jgi:hypothetical protein